VCVCVCVCTRARVRVAGAEGDYVSLQFTSMLTECSYDYVFVYDGRSYDSPLLGSFSGGTKPDLLISTQQYVSSTSHLSF